MTVDLREFFEATDPSRTLAIDNVQDKKYYIDFSAVRGGDIISKLYQKLIRSRFVFEYRDAGESWFDVNPILAEARELST